MNYLAWVYISQEARAGGGELRTRLRKVKDLVNNASILAIFLLRLCIRAYHPTVISEMNLILGISG